MSLYKIKNPVEYSFFQWMNNFPDSGHWADKERFYKFVKTVCRYNAVKWKNVDFINKKILDIKPHFDSERLDYLLQLFNELVQFYKMWPVSTQFQLSDRKIKDGHYIEIQMKKGVIVEKEMKLKLPVIFIPPDV